MEPDVAGAAIGIDLGTTYSCVAIYHHGRVDVVVNRQGNRTTPSYVAFTSDDLLVGEAAKNQAARNPTNTIYDAKRLIGRRFADAEVQGDLKLWPFKVTGDDGAEGVPMIQVDHKGARRQLAPQEISAILLRELRGMAEAYLGAAVRDAVITVPAHFSHSQRRATKEAGEAAGLRVLRVLSEPTAAAVAYGLDGNRTGGAAGRTVLIFDLGGGTFDVSLLSVRRGEVHVRAASGDGHLGGVDFDGRLVDHCVKQFERTHGVGGVGESPRALARLRAACEEAKKNLSFMVEANIEVECLHQGLDLRTTVSRARFEELTADLLERCMGCVRGCLRDAGAESSSVDEVVLVGGSTRIPRIQELVTELFGAGRLCRSINPDEAVAHGAAIRAAALGGSSAQKLREGRDLALRDVTPLSLGLRTLGGVMNVLIPRNTPIPSTTMKDFTTTKDGQTALTFVVYEGEQSLVKDNNLLGRFTLSGIPGAGRSGPRVKVVFSVDEDGILTVTARDKASGRTAEERIVVDGKLRLRDVDVQQRVEGAARNRKRDAEARRKVEARIRLAEAAEELRKEGSEDAAAEVLSWLERNYEKVGAEEIDKKRMALEFKRGEGELTATFFPATPANESKLHRRKWFVFWK